MSANDNTTQGPEMEALRKQVIQVLRSCYDPEIPVNIYDLGLIYGLEVEPPGKVSIVMTLTAPNCPVAGSLPEAVKLKVGQVQGVADVNVALTWDPPWNPSKMSDAAKLQLGFDAVDEPPRTVRFGA
jgi:FeS assembly SUF system protein